MNSRRAILLAISISLLALGISVALSFMFGAKSIEIGTIVDIVKGNIVDSHSKDVFMARIPRTIFGVLAGVALAISGSLMQSITRNPVADPSILGVNTGASLFVVMGMAFMNISDGNSYVVLAFIGGAITSAFVYILASVGMEGATPIKLALAGAAVSTAFKSLVNTIMLPNTQIMDQFRFWQVGSISRVTFGEIYTAFPYIGVGVVISLFLIPYLNVLQLGDEMASSLGISVNKVRFISAFSGVLLSSVVTAFAGPIAFVGLMVPHIVRNLFSSKMEVVIPISAILGASVLLLSDVVGRVLGGNGEIESGIITALIGAPVFVYIIGRIKVNAL